MLKPIIIALGVLSIPGAALAQQILDQKTRVCDGEVVAFETADKSRIVADATMLDAPIADATVKWWCDDSPRTTECPVGTERVNFAWAQADHSVTIHCADEPA